MSGISSGVGLVSGINYQSLITQLIAIEQVPGQIVQSKIDTVNAENQAFASLSTGLNGIQTIANSLQLPQTFQAATATSSNPNILTATAAQGAAVGSYQFQVAQLVTTQQSITNGFASSTNTPIGAGTLTFELGGGEAFSQTPLSQLNGGQGVQRGQFRITDGSGSSSVIDTSNAVTLDDVINSINSAANISVKATLSNQGIVLTDTSGQTKNDLTVTDLGGGGAASSLGIAGDAGALATVLTGTNINYIGAGTLLSTLNDGRGVNAASANDITTSTLTSSLGGGAGLGVNPSGSDFTINTADGSTFTVSLKNVTTIAGVLSAISTAGGGKVVSGIAPGNQQLELIDQTTGPGTLGVVATTGSTAASRLGLLTPATGKTLVGSDISSPDFQVNLADGSSFAVTIGASQTVGDVLNAINNASGGTATASVGADGQSFSIADNTIGAGSLSVNALNGSSAAGDLGILKSGSGGVVSGSAVQAGLDSVLVSSLRGGAGIPLGNITLTDRQGNSGTIDLSGARSVSDILNLINGNNDGILVTASINSSGTGIQLKDTSGGSGNLIVADNLSATATLLGIAGTFGTTTTADVGANLQRQFISQNTLLSTVGGGKGVNLGVFTITNSAGASSVIDLTKGTINTVGDVINAINTAKSGVTASINANGNGILLTDNAGGKLKLNVADTNGTSASDLNIAGTATGTTIDGAFEKTIAVSATDTLASVQSAINKLNFGVTAQIVNDGSPTNPFRLAITSQNSGHAGRVLIDGGTTNLSPSTLVAGQDAAVFLGGGSGGSSQPLLITSSTNQLTNVIKGVTINLTGAGSQPVTLNVALDPSNVASDLQNFVQQFNAITAQIGTFTQFNTNTNQGGLLLGNETAQQITEVLFNTFNSTVTGGGQYKSLSDIGITVGANAQLQFDSNTFSAAYAADPTAVQTLFSQTKLTLNPATGKNDTVDKSGFGYLISNAVTELTDPINGIITLQETTLTQRASNYQDYLSELNVLVAQKKTQLENQFANLESTIASLQSQQQVIGSLSGTAAATAGTTTPNSSSSGSSSSSSSGTSSSTSTSGG